MCARKNVSDEIESLNLMGMKMFARHPGNSDEFYF